MTAADVEPAAPAAASLEDAHLRSSVTSTSSAISLELTKPGSTTVATSLPNNNNNNSQKPISKRPSLEDRLAARASVRGGGLRNAAMSSRLLGANGTRVASNQESSNGSLGNAAPGSKDNEPQQPRSRRASLEDKLALRASVRGGGLRNSALSSRMLGSSMGGSSLQDAARAAQESLAMGSSTLSNVSLELSPGPTENDDPTPPNRPVSRRASLADKLAARASERGGGLRNSALSSRMLRSSMTGGSSLLDAAKAAQESLDMGSSNVSLELTKPSSPKDNDDPTKKTLNKRPSMEDMIAARMSVRGGLRSTDNLSAARINKRAKTDEGGTDEDDDDLGASRRAQDSSTMGDSNLSLEDRILAKRTTRARSMRQGNDSLRSGIMSIGTSRDANSLNSSMLSSALSSDLLASAREVQASMGITSVDGASSHSSRPGVRRSASRPVVSAGVLEGGVPSSIEDNVKKRLSQRGSLARRSSSRPGSMVSFASALTDEGITPVTEESGHGSANGDEKKADDDDGDVERGERSRRKRSSADSGELMQSMIVDKNDHMTKFRKYAKYFCVALLLIVGIVIGVAVTASRKNVEDQIAAMATQNPSMVPSSAPTVSSAPSMVPSISPTTSLKLATRDYLGNISDASALEDPTTPQGKAFQWIYEDDQTYMNETNFIQRYTLAVIYYSTKGDLWNVCSDGDFACNYGFHYLSKGIDECTWFKNKCNKDGQIIELTFVYLDADNDLKKTGNNLQGTIPSEISQLTELSILNFDSNKLTGTIPESFGDLTKLYSFITNNNPLQSPLPESFFNLKNLYILSMTNNLLTGPIPTEFGSMPDLGVIRLDRNTFTGDVPNEFGQLTNLEVLTLAQNNLNGTVHEGLYDCTFLREFSIYTNDLTGTIPTTIGNLNYLVKYDVAFNYMSGTIPTEVGKMRSLARFWLKSNQFDGTIPESLGNLRSAEQLEFSVNSFTGTMPDSICELGLTRLEADCEEVTCDCCTVCLVDEV